MLKAIGDVDERILLAVERSDFVLTPPLTECVENLIASSHVRTSFDWAAQGGVGPTQHTRGNPQATRYSWER